MFIKICEQMGMMGCVKEHRFHPTRRWRIDFAFLDIKLACEIEGGVFNYGRHIRPTGFLKDMEKYSALTEMGWRLLRYEPKHIDYEQILRVYKTLMSG